MLRVPYVFFIVSFLVHRSKSHDAKRGFVSTTMMMFFLDFNAHPISNKHQYRDKVDSVRSRMNASEDSTPFFIPAAVISAWDISLHEYTPIRRNVKSSAPLDSIWAWDTKAWYLISNVGTGLELLKNGWSHKSFDVGRFLGSACKHQDIRCFAFAMSVLCVLLEFALRNTLFYHVAIHVTPNAQAKNIQRILDFIVVEIQREKTSARA